MKITTHHTYDYTKIKKEKNNQPSCTIPDQAMSIQEIMRRYARGIPLAGNVPVYEDQETLQTSDGVNFETLDLSEQHSLIKARQEELTEIKKREGKKQVSKFRQSIIDEYEKEKAAAQAAAPTNNDTNKPV